MDDLKNVGESSYSPGDGKDQRVQSLVFMMMMMMMMMMMCCILRGPGGERIVDVVPRGTELELQLRRGVGQAAHICNNLHVKSTGVY